MNHETAHVLGTAMIFVLFILREFVEEKNKYLGTEKDDVSTNAQRIYAKDAAATEHQNPVALRFPVFYGQNVRTARGVRSTSHSGHCLVTPHYEQQRDRDPPRVPRLLFLARMRVKVNYSAGIRR